MNTVRIFSIYLASLTIVMIGVLVFGFTRGDFWEEGAILTDMPWGIVSLFDVYVGFLLFCAWIWYREPRFWAKALLTIGILLGGNAVSALYAWVALLRSKGDLHVFFLGRFASSASSD